MRLVVTLLCEDVLEREELVVEVTRVVRLDDDRVVDEVDEVADKTTEVDGDADEEDDALDVDDDTEDDDGDAANTDSEKIFTEFTSQYASVKAKGLFAT